jgi:hypothetical protein
MVVPVVVVAAEAPPAHACSCLSRTEAEAFADSDAVFTGRPAGRPIPRRETSQLGPANVWTFTVREVYKGKVLRKQRVVSAVDSAACGVAFPKKVTMLVFASTSSPDRGDPLQVNSCGATRPLSDGPLDPSLGTPSPPERPRQR